MDSIDILWSIACHSYTLHLKLVCTCKQYNSFFVNNKECVRKQFQRCEIDEDGNEYFYIEDKLWSFDDNPSVVRSCGTLEWHIYGKKHRNNDLPAVILKNGTMIWYKHGKIDRYPQDDDKPAIVYSNGTKEWWRNGEHHRGDDKPATIHSDGTQLWFLNNRLERQGRKPVIVGNNRYCYVSSEEKRACVVQ